MKLFGNSRQAVRYGASDKAPAAGGRAFSETRKSGFWKSMNRGKRAVIVILSVILVLMVAFLAFYGGYVKPPKLGASPLSAQSIDPDTGTAIQTGDLGTAPHKQDYYNILLCGTDNGGTRTDTMMIARLDVKNHTAALMSIPRDTLIQTGSGIAKLNSVYGTYGTGVKGIEALELELQDILGFMPDGYALVDLNAFIELVDLLGGVEYNVPQDMYYVDPTQDLYIDLKAGSQLLDGEHAMQLVRFRKYAMADIERTHVQQDFLKTVAKKCISISSLTKIKGYCKIFNENVTTNLSAGNLLYFAQELMKCDLDQMETFTLPGEGKMISGGSYYDLYTDQVQEIVNGSFYPYADR